MEYDVIGKYTDQFNTLKYCRFHETFFKRVFLTLIIIIGYYWHEFENNFFVRTVDGGVT